jgi:hypothetical protein
VAPIVPALLALLAPVPASAQIVLQNDGWFDGANAGFQGGFVAGEKAASRLIAPGPFPMQILNVQLLFGGSTDQEFVTLEIYDDDGSGTAPGTLLHQSDWLLTGSSTALNEIDLSSLGLEISGTFHVAIAFQHSGFPSVARDDDGSIQSGQNFIWTDLGGGATWFDSQLFGLTGDWIIRATVAAPGGGTDEPRILSIDDVGNDQGRQVRLRFARSEQDEGGATTPITQYEVHRRVDGFAARPASDLPIGRVDGWDYVGSLPAHGDDVYSVVVPTLADSTIANGQYWSVFFVRAATANPVVFYDSAPDSGYSLDNLAPAPPGNVLHVAGDVMWDSAPEEDFDYFTVYGSDVPVLDGSETLLAQTTATSHFIGAVPYAYVLVTATDFSGNEGDAGFADLSTDVPEVAGGLAELRAWPNPFRGATSVSFESRRQGRVSVAVYDASGRLVRRLLDEVSAPGRRIVPWDGRDAAGRVVADGVYLVRVTADDRVERTKVVLLR